MDRRRAGIAIWASLCLVPAFSQQRAEDAIARAREQLIVQGFSSEDLADLEVKNSYLSDDTGLRHTRIRQRWQGIEIFNGDIVVHLRPDGSVLKMDNGAWSTLAKRVNATAPAVSGQAALVTVLAGTAPSVPAPALIASEDAGRLLTFDGSLLGDEPVRVQLMYQAVDDHLVLVWNVNHYMPDGSHWWNVRIDALSGQEVGRNDWVSQCGFDHGVDAAIEAAPEPPPPPTVANDLRVYATPVESPNHGARTVKNAPWTSSGIASPYGWNDDNGFAGPEYTITRGNNVWAQEDANNNNGTGYSPTSATLDFDYALNLGGAPSTYQDAAITNLYFWNNLMHDVWYQYGFNEASGNFQQNNYGRGGLGSDYVYADAQDGGGTNNANFATPADGTKPRMQMYVWNYTTPNRDGDVDNCIIAHEYTHGISNRLVGGGNVNCLFNNEQMGEGWSDWFGLMMTIEPGDQGTDRRGVGTYVIGQATTGTGIRPAPYSTDFAQNNYTYATTNNGALAVPHGIGFVWCTILWEVSWELINAYGFDPNLYTGTGGNNIAMHLIIDGMKLTPCNPGFVDARDAILLADQNNYGGAHTGLLWNAFARRGLGASASQGSSASRFDQVEAYDTPFNANLGAVQVLTPTSPMLNCVGATVTVSATLRNYGLQAQTNFPARYQLDGGAWVNQNYSGTLAPGASANFTFTQTATLSAVGSHTLVVATNLAGDMFTGNDAVTTGITVNSGTTSANPFYEGLVSASVPAPAGWTLQNPDGGTTWSTTVLANGPNCASNRAWSIDLYNYSATGQEDRLLTPKINLTTAIGSHLTFQHAYAPYSSTYYDAFRVDISTNCGGSWTQIYYAAGAALATAPNNTAAWAPTNCSQWQSHNIDISAYDGQTVMFRFTSINGFGNFFYMDNVNVFSDTQLPVELTLFTAKPEQAGIMLDWTTASEVNSDRFDVERSGDMGIWSIIGAQPAAGNSFASASYHFLDASPLPGTNYYRLNMVDLDGSMAYSSIASAEWMTTGPSIFPNPNSGSFWVAADQGTPIEVLDALGRKVSFTSASDHEGALRIDLNMPGSGLYVVRIGSGESIVIEPVMVSGER